MSHGCKRGMWANWGKEIWNSEEVNYFDLILKIVFALSHAIKLFYQIYA